MKHKKVVIDVLMEGLGGDLVFKPVEFQKTELKNFVRKERNPVIKYNAERAAKEKKVKV